MLRIFEYVCAVALVFCLPWAGYMAINYFVSTNSNTTQVASQAHITNQLSQDSIEVSSQPTARPIKLLFVGDIMLDRTIRKDGERIGYQNLFACLEEKFSQYDSVIGNLEGAVTDYESVSRDASYLSAASFRFTFDKEAVKVLRDLGLSVVSLANNHIKDFGDIGIAQTVYNLNTLDVLHFGNPQPGVQRWALEEINSTKIAYIPYNEFYGTVEQTMDDLQQSQSFSDIQIVFAHWGSEYVPVRFDVKQKAHQFVSAGADLIIGAHPHVVQESEIYQGVPIYYSLGNFIFDQYFQPEVMEGLAVSIEILNNSIHLIEESRVKSERNKGTCFVK